MPDNIQIGSFVFGAILLLLGLVGGNIKVFSAEIAKDVSNPIRVVAAILGLILIANGIFDPLANTTISKSLSSDREPLATPVPISSSPTDTGAVNANQLPATPTLKSDSVPSIPPAPTPSAEIIPANNPTAVALDAVQTNLQESGAIAKDQTTDYTITGTANVPLLITMTRQDEYYYSIEILDPDSASVLDSNNLGATAKVPFTPQTAGQYTIRVKGNGGFGNYTIKVAPLDPQQTSGDQTTPIELGTSIDGIIAAGAKDYYTFTGTPNIPVLITMTRQDEYYSSIEILDPDSASVLDSNNLGATAKIPFTPQTAGQYTIHIKGNGGFGSYTINVALLDPQQASGEQTTSIEPGTSIDGIIAAGAKDYYTITGTPNVPLLITMTRQDEYYSSIEILDPDSASVLDSNNLGATAKIPFTPQTAGQYTIHIKGNGGFGNYTIKVALLDPQQASGDQTIPLEPGTSIDGIIAAGAKDYYTFTGTPNIPVLITMTRQDEYYSSIEILDPDSASVLDSNNLGATAKIPFTPQTAGQYTIHIKGNGGFGAYKISLAQQ